MVEWIRAGTVLPGDDDDPAVLMTLYNDYHKAGISVRVQDDTPLSASQVARIRRTLCGSKGCSCGNDLNMRGPQTVDVIPVAQADGTDTYYLYAKDTQDD